ncbi:MAG TPA: DUF5666 domain-containing protein [Dehalococcoidia bacterium]|nr:DUF5666 domain-containing protein [Dehalococcoidia bacterium]
MRINIKSCLAGLAGLALVATTACDAAAQAQLQGILQNVDSVSGDVTVKLNDGSVITVNLKDVKVEALASAVGNASLEPGSNVTIELDGEQRVKKLKSHAVEVEGVIKALDPAKGEVTIDADGAEVTLQVTPDTKIELEDEDSDGTGATFADLQVGQEVEAKYPAGATTALKIEVDDQDEEDDDAAVAGDQGADDDDDEDDREVHGTVTAVNQSTKEVTIRGRDGVEATYQVMPSTKLENHGRAAFDAIQTGMVVEAKFHPVTKELMKLQVED